MSQTPSQNSRLIQGFPSSEIPKRHVSPAITPSSSVFPSSPPVFPPSTTHKRIASPKLPYRSPSPKFGAPRLLFPVRLTDPIASSEGLDATLLAACNVAEKTGANTDSRSETSSSGLSDDLSEWGDTQAFLADNIISENEDSEDEHDWEDDLDSLDENNDLEEETAIRRPKQTRQGRHNETWLNSTNTVYAKNKLIRILKGDDLIPKQRWGIDKILATLVEHRKDEKLRTPYRLFRLFAYRTIMKESDKFKGRWPKALGKSDWTAIIDLQAQSEVERCYGKEIQDLCKSSAFGMLSDTQPGQINLTPLENIVQSVTRVKRPFLVQRRRIGG